MKKYDVPALEYLLFSGKDLITASALTDDKAENDDMGYAPSGWFTP